MAAYPLRPCGGNACRCRLGGLNGIAKFSGDCVSDEQQKSTPRAFWEKGWVWAVIAAASLIPFLAPTILPFNDLPNHVGRHAVFLAIDRDPFFRQFYTVHWFLAGNLGVDLIVRAIGPVLGAELATKLAVAAIAPLTVSGIYWLARMLHGRVPPSALVAASLTWSWPLVTGFANFCLSAAIALNVLALWIGLRHLPFLVRLLIFAPLGFVTWVAHTAGWGLLGLGVGTYELVRAWDQRQRWVAILLAPFQTLPFALMLVVTILWRARTTTGLGIIASFSVRHKLASVLSLFRERFIAWDLLSLAVFAGLTIWFFWKGGRRIVPAALAISIAYCMAFVICPETLFFSGFADRRLLPYGMMMLPLAVGVGTRAKPSDIRYAAFATLGFLGLRLAISTIVWEQASLANEKRLDLVAHVPPHSRIFGLVVEQCAESWVRVGRPDHIQMLAIPRRQSFVSGMFQNSGLSQVTARFATDPNDTIAFNPNMLALVHDQRCPVSYIRETLQSAVQRLPHTMFDYVWIIGEEAPGAYDTRGLTLIASQGNDRLYKIVDRRPAFSGPASSARP